MTGSVLVVGGGIAGRAAARALAKHDLSCTLLERRESSGRGMGVNLPGNAVRALAELGLPERALSDGLPLRRREYRNRRGHLLFTMDEDSFWGGVGRSICIRHGDLVNALALPETAVLERVRAVQARPSSDGVEILVEGHSSPRRFDFAIGADGVHSLMRDAVTQDVLRPSSMTRSAWRFVGDNPGVDCWTAWSGRDVTFLMIPMTEDLVYGYAARTRGGHVGSHRSWLAQAAEGFPAVVGAAVAHGMRSGELHHAAVDEVRLDTWHHGRLVLIGDAAHATGPVWAQGVAMALEDASVLAELLARTATDSWVRVGPELEKLRRPRVEHVRRATDRMSRLAALPGWLRDVSAPVLGPKSYRAAYDPLLGPNH